MTFPSACLTADVGAGRLIPALRRTQPSAYHSETTGRPAAKSDEGCNWL
jgi:hypothetical protein